VNRVGPKMYLFTANRELISQKKNHCFLTLKGKATKRRGTSLARAREIEKNKTVVGKKEREMSLFERSKTIGGFAPAVRDGCVREKGESKKIAAKRFLRKLTVMLSEGKDVPREGNAERTFRPK